MGIATDCAGNALALFGNSTQMLTADYRSGHAGSCSKPVNTALPWREALNMRDALWLFDAGDRQRASLIVDFHPDEDGAGVVADLFDDQNGDGKVSYATRDGIPYPADSAMVQPFPYSPGVSLSTR